MGWFKSNLGSLGAVLGGTAGFLVGGPAGAAIGAGIGGTVGQGASDNYNYKRQLKAQYGLIDYQNAYNSPVEQMVRLKQARLNPNLVYNSGSATMSSASGSVPNYDTNAYKAYANALSLYNLEAQNQYLDWQTSNIAQQSLLNGRKANIAFYNQEYAKREYDTFKKTGKIPESYYRGMNDLSMISRSIDQLLQYFAN